MPDALAQALAHPGLWVLAITMGLAGIVRGFTGFGTALIFVPVAGLFFLPAQVIAMTTVTGFLSSAAMMPKAWAEGERWDVAYMVVGAVIGAPLGLAILGRLDPSVVRWMVTGVAVITLLALMTGWRAKTSPAGLGLAGIGFSAGVVGGMTGLTGPVVVLFYLSGPKGAAVVRANTILFLAALDAILLGTLLMQGAMTWMLLWFALLIGIPYVMTTLIGQRLFDPRLEAVYRWGAYAVVALAVLRGLPLWES